MKTWLKENIINKIDDAIHPEEGGLCQNSSERVGTTALSYRGKDGTPLGPTHYICSTGLAIAHVNSIVINTFRRELAAEGI
eukprot:1364653-Prymnesium_polylepis.1